MDIAKKVMGLQNICRNDFVYGLNPEKSLMGKRECLTISKLKLVHMKKEAGGENYIKFVIHTVGKCVRKGLGSSSGGRETQ